MEQTKVRIAGWRERENGGKRGKTREREFVFRI